MFSVVEFFNTSQITALDIEVKCVGIDQDLDYSVVVMHDQQSINIGNKVVLALQTSNIHIYISPFFICISILLILLYTLIL